MVFKLIIKIESLTSSDSYVKYNHRVHLCEHELKQIENYFLVSVRIMFHIKIQEHQLQTLIIIGILFIINSSIIFAFCVQLPDS